MASFNKVMLIGNLTRDPQLSYTPNQVAVVDFGLAVNRRWTGKDGEKKEEVCFVDCTSFGRPGETINKYMNKGRSIFIEGRLSFSSWVSQDGGKRSKLKVIVENFQFLGSGQGGGGQGDSSQSDSSQGGGDGYEAGSNSGGAPIPSDDDIPF